MVPDGEASWNHGNLTLMACDEALASDPEVFLDTFCLVRAHTAKGFLPAKLQTNDNLSDYIEEVENTMMLDCVFGAREYDARTKFEEGYMSLTLDGEIDPLLGPTAARLRRDRFQFWKMDES